MSMDNIKTSQVKLKPGVIYLSTIPDFMNVTKIKEVFSEYGKVRTVYLQLAHSGQKAGEKSKKKRAARRFTEGWVEFERKSIAKKVVQLLNNQQVSTRKKSKQYDCIWNLKYLSGFKWHHLHERLAFEKAERRQKLRDDMEAAKKTRSIFSLSSGKHKNKLANTNDEETTKSTNVIKADWEENKEKYIIRTMF